MTSINKKLVIVGDGHCGKTFLLDVLKNDQLLPNLLEVSTADIFTKNIVVDGKQVALQIWDTNGKEECEQLRRWSYSDADVVLMCFSIDYSYLIDNISIKWLPEVKYFMPDVPIILVCNKKELRNDASTIEELRKMKKKPLTTEDGEVIAKQINAFAYLECSAVTKDGVKEVFETAARAALQPKKKNGVCTLL